MQVLKGEEVVIQKAQSPGLRLAPPQIDASRNPFRSSSAAEYSAVVFVAIFAIRPKF